MKEPTTGKPRGGRPRRRKYKEGERVPLSLRVTPQIKHLIDRASAAFGRSQSAEVEFRLERSEYTEGLLPDALVLRHGVIGARLMLAQSTALETVRQMACHLTVKESGKWDPDHWLEDDPRCWAEAEIALAHVVARLRPVNPAPPPPPHDPQPPSFDGLGRWAGDQSLIYWGMELSDNGDLLPGKRPVNDYPPTAAERAAMQRKVDAVLAGGSAEAGEPPVRPTKKRRR